MGGPTPRGQSAFARQFEAETPNRGCGRKSTRGRASLAGGDGPTGRAVRGLLFLRSHSPRPLSIDRICLKQRGYKDDNWRRAPKIAAPEQGRNADERTRFLECADGEGRHLPPRIHGSRRRAGSLGRSDFNHAGERRRARRRNAAQGRRSASSASPAAARPTASTSPLQRLGDDRRQPRPVQRFGRMGPGRQAASGARRELRAEERRQGLDLQSSQGDQVLERPGIHRRRRGLLAEPSPRRHQIRRGWADEGSLRRQEARQAPDPGLARVP